MSCCESCGGITLFKGEDGTTIYNGVGAPTIVANEGDFYIDTNTYEIYGPYTGGSWGSGTSLIGPEGLAGPTGVGITSIVWTSNSGGQPQGTQGTTDTYTITLSDATTSVFVVTNGADGIDANSEYGNTVFVDRVYGNNATAARERFDLPYLTISSAITAAVSGDTVYVRSGNYTGNIVLKNGVNLYFEKVTVTGQLTDNGATVSCNVLGNLSLTFTGNNPINITGINSDVSIQMDTIHSTGNGVRVEPGLGNSSTFSLVAKRITGQQINYFITCDGVGKIFIDIKESMETPATTSETIQFKGIFISEFAGEFYLKCPKVYIGNAIFEGGGVFFEEELTTSGGKIYVEVEDVTIDYDFASPGEAYSINKVGRANTVLNIKNLKCIARGGLLVTGNTDAGIGYLRYEGNIVSERQPAMRYASNHRCIVKSSSLKRNSGGSNLDETLVIGNPAGYSALTSGTTSGYQLEIINTEIIKDKGNLAGAASGIIAKSGVPIVNIKDCDIYGFNTFAGNSATATVGQGDILFKNTLGNTALAVSVTDTSIAGGFSVDAGLRLYDYID